MGWRRAVNSLLGRTTGYELRRPDPPAPRAASRVPKIPAFLDLPPVDRVRDRLLLAPIFPLAPMASGSALLRAMLDGHSQLHTLSKLAVWDLGVDVSTPLAASALERHGLNRPELEHLLWDRLLHRVLVKSNKRFVVDQTPSNIFHWRRIAQCWPDARFIFVLDHPLSIARAWAQSAPEAEDRPGHSTPEAVRHMQALDEARRGLSGLTLRQEELTADPERESRRICAFLDVAWEPAMLSEIGPLLGEGGSSHRVHGEVPPVLEGICESWGYVTRGSADEIAPDGQAEVAEIWPRDGYLRLLGTVHGRRVDANDHGRLAVVLRDHGEVVRDYDVAFKGAGFDVTVPVGALIPPGPEERVSWEPYLLLNTPEGQMRLRLGRHLDDIPHKRRVMTFPEQGVREAGGYVTIRPRYTARNNLLIDCLREERDSA
jgi:hypothetical protein